MNRNEFLARLSELIAALPTDERENAIRYYEEYFDDAGPENEARVIAELGSPEDCAQQILSAGMLEPQAAKHKHDTMDGGEANSAQTGTAPRRRDSHGLLIFVLAICALPILLPLVLAAIAVVLALAVAAAAVLLALGVAGIGCTLAGVALFFRSAVLGAFVLGIGLIAGGLTWLLLVPLVKLMVKACVGVIRFITERLGRLLYRSRQGARI